MCAAISLDDSNNLQKYLIIIDSNSPIDDKSALSKIGSTGE